MRSSFSIVFFLYLRGLDKGIGFLIKRTNLIISIEFHQNQFGNMVKTCRSLQSLQLQIIRFEKSMKLGMGIGIKKNIPIQFQFPFHIERTKPIGRTKHEEIARNDNYKKKRRQQRVQGASNGTVFIYWFIYFVFGKRGPDRSTYGFVWFDFSFDFFFIIFFFCNPKRDTPRGLDFLFDRDGARSLVFRGNRCDSICRCRP